MAMVSKQMLRLWCWGQQILDQVDGYVAIRGSNGAEFPSSCLCELRRDDLTRQDQWQGVNDCLEATRTEAADSCRYQLRERRENNSHLGGVAPPPVAV